MSKVMLISGFLCWAMSLSAIAQANEDVRIGIVGLVHGHVHGILRQMQEGKVKVVGIAEADQELARQYSERYGYDMNIVYPNVDEMIEATQPEAVTAFTSTKDHLSVVESCAPQGVHVMVEKPLAVDMADARAIARLAAQHNIEVLTNYETTWYASNHRAYEVVHQDQSIGGLRKIVVRDGHEGPKEIGVGPEFLEWLTDPEENGGGALMDFGCYGANLITWLMQGERPLSVTAIVQQIKPEVYPQVDDEATILLKYPETQGIIQASWNWPFSRKDMSVYGKSGYVYALNSRDMKIRMPGEQEKAMDTEARKAPYNDPFAFFSAVVRNEIQVKPTDLSSLENNLIVMEILDAAKLSASSGTTIHLRR